MWICLNNAFLSIVEPTRNARGASPFLLVRARRPGDIERVFPSAVVSTEDNRDYMFRAMIDREHVAAAIAAQVLGISYGNFKDSVDDHGLHDAYASVWGVMARQQPQRPYSRYSQPVRRPAQRGFAAFDEVPAKPAPRRRATKTTAGA
jgi:hypothetical protein